ncbi:hypothetical protein R3W88_004302 [Solanum pinnatisectum]|uniref:Endonuclease/exonuclease/phosphatase domain-containing protein n=1 Tax=Solanum pinnatisectum TaxID=50273 RepID=A0AAV9KB06_9SOLN|nr:hypothetical protein R3W88_004302 [Solanum pinnatisectum]
MGDVNSILHIEDRIVGSQVQEIELRDFKQCLLDTGLTELKTVGRNYTWTNGHTYSCIDKAFVNALWMQTWTHLECSILDPRFSYHSPLCVKIEAGEDTGPKPFKFFNYLADHPEFMQTAETSWKSQRQVSSMSEVWRKIKRLKQPMSGLSNHYFQGIQSRVIMIRTQLKALKEQMRCVQGDNQMEQYQAEKSLKAQLEKWRNLKESATK